MLYLQKDINFFQQTKFTGKTPSRW